MVEKLDEILTEKTSHMSTQVGIKLPKLKKVSDLKNQKINYQK